METSAFLIAGLLVAVFAVFTVVRAVRIVPQARARNVERLGRYLRTLNPGLNFVIPYIDRVHGVIDLREQVVSFKPQPVITEDNLVVEIDTVLYFQVTDPRAAFYEIANFLQQHFPLPQEIPQLTFLCAPLANILDAQQYRTFRTVFVEHFSGIQEHRASPKTGKVLLDLVSIHHRIV